VRAADVRYRPLIGDSATRVLLAVLCGASTYEQLVKVTGKNRATIHEHLVRLRAEGLVDWDSGRWGTLHPAVSVVALTPEAQ
jgi:DNA-binding IclR family transcriptional regulator